jgi:hypothetical protein
MIVGRRGAAVQRMRMTNDRDQALLRSAVADTAANFLAFLPGRSAPAKPSPSAKAWRCRRG